MKSVGIVVVVDATGRNGNAVGFAGVVKNTLDASKINHTRQGPQQRQALHLRRQAKMTAPKMNKKEWPIDR